MADIQFTSEIKIDTAKAKKDIRDLASQINDVFNQTGLMMSAALRRKNFGLSQYVGSYDSALDATEKLLDSAKGKASTKGGRAALRDATKNLGKVRGLTYYMDALSKYDKLYSSITALQTLTAADKIDPAKGLGRYGTLQRYSNRLLSLLYKGNLAYPSIVDQKILEKGEYYRDINRKSGSMNRAALRYIQERKYSASSISRAGDFMLMSGDSGIQALNDIYGLGLGSDSARTPKRVNAKAYEALSAWKYAGLEANRHKQALLAGGLSPAEFNYELAAYKEQMKAFIDLQKKLFPQEKAIAENLKKLNKSDLLMFGGGKNPTEPTVGGAIWGAIGSKLAKDVFGAAGDMLESYWGEAVTRNVYASRQAQLGRVTTGGRVAGSIIGALLAGAATGFNPVAMGAGYGAGKELGALFGKYGETMYKSDIKSSSDMMNRMRNKALWGSSYNTYFAKAITDMGVANGEEAMGGLADRAMSLRGRMMLGQVGEMEMLYYSMMPNYYAALMEGITGPKLMSIYQKDLNAIGDPSMRYVVGQAIGNTEAFAAARSTYFGNYAGTFAKNSARYEKGLTSIEAGFASARGDAAIDTMLQDYTEILNSAKRGDKTIFKPSVVKGASFGLSKDELLSIILREAATGGAGLTNAALTGNIQFVNIIKLPDGTEISRDVKTADEIYTDSWAQFVGS